MLVKRLAEAGFDEANVARWWGVPLLSDIRHRQAPARRNRKGIGAAIALFVAGESVPLRDLGALAELPDGLVEPADDGLVRARVSLWPCRGALVLADRLDAPAASAVVALDLSALNVAACLPPGAGRALDLGCGAGLQSLLLAARGARVTASDVDERALDFARRSAALARAEIGFVRSDLFAAIAPGSFDLIVFNAPLERAPIANATDEPIRYTRSPRALLVPELLAALPGRLAATGECLLHAQLTAEVLAALAALDRAVLAVEFAESPDGTPHALVSIRPGRGLRRVRVPLSPRCPHLRRELLDALHRPLTLDDAAVLKPAPWLELRRRGHFEGAAARFTELAFGPLPISEADLTLLGRLDGRSVGALGLDGTARNRLHDLGAAGLVVPLAS
jgi:SAM-dependent methyltransferase